MLEVSQIDSAVSQIGNGIPQIGGESSQIGYAMPQNRLVILQKIKKPAIDQVTNLKNLLQVSQMIKKMIIYALAASQSQVLATINEENMVVDALFDARLPGKDI